ncbi:MAG: hypothetical protein AABM29_08485 [Actinomycetota bacterium]
MAERQQVPESTELIYLPRPSWAPAFLALGAALAVSGIYGEGFLFRGYVYMIAGGVIALLALRSLVVGSARDFYALPRRQRPRSAVLPAASLKPPPKQG